jgi:hypothetical protein
VKPAIEIMQERAASATRELVARSPSGSVRAVFAGGSVGRGEVWSRLDGTTLTIYSDLDLYVVLAENADHDAVRRAAATVARAMPSEQDGVVFKRGVDVGVYPLDDLRAQPIRPGTVDLFERHFWLHGDPSIMDRLRTALARPMAATEALYLLENRAWDALEAAADATPFGTATAAKAVLDVLAAHLIGEGRFRPTYAARRDQLSERAPIAIASGDLELIAAAERIRAGDYSRPLQPSAALDAVSRAWCTVAPAILGADPASSPAQLVALRCRRGAITENYREFVRLRRRARLSLASAVVRGWRYASLSPRSTLRTRWCADWPRRRASPPGTSPFTNGMWRACRGAWVLGKTPWTSVRGPHFGWCRSAWVARSFSCSWSTRWDGKSPSVSGSVATNSRRAARSARCWDTARPRFPVCSRVRHPPSTVRGRCTVAPTGAVPSTFFPACRLSRAPWSGARGAGFGATPTRARG